MASTQAYAFDNDSTVAGDHHDALAALWDEFSAARATSLLSLDGARCLEVAAGGGGFALWLAEQVGQHGQVIATDLKPAHIPTHPRLRACQHDIVTDEIDGEFDFIHARLLLNHLPQRREVVHKLAAALRPGGVLLTEDQDPSPPADMVAHTPRPEDADLLTRCLQAQVRVLAGHGGDPTWSRRALAAMIDEGLTDVQTVVHARSWRGADPGCRLLAVGLVQLRDEFIAAGMNAADLDRVHAMLDNPQIVLHGFRLCSTAGRRAPT
jgi:SAM-dependent methyltransferase